MGGRKITFKDGVMWCYIVVMVGMLFALLLILMTGRGFKVDYGLGDYRDISADWTDENDRPMDFSQLAKTGEVVAYYRLPQMLHDTGLVYRSQNVYTKVYLDDELIYETTRMEGRSYNKPPGGLWNIVSFTPDQAGKQLKLEIIAVYQGEGLRIDHVYWGDPASVLLSMIKEKLLSVVVSMTICFGGIIMILLDIPINYKKARKNHSLRYLGIFSLCIGGWSLIEANILQLFVADPWVLQVIDNMLLILSVMPIILYADWNYGILRYPLVRAFCVLQILYLFSCVVLPLAGMMDWHTMLPAARVFMAVSATGFVIWTIKQNLSVLLSKERKYTAGVWAVSLQLLGIGALGITALLELIRYSAVYEMDHAFVLRFGLLIFIICFALGSQFGTYQLIAQGMEYDSVHELAYSDALTKLQNRAAYLERLEACVTEHVQELGIIYMDVNNLKSVNDTLGHEVGDVMIQSAAGIISESFGQFGIAFRLGGDEFCILIEEDVLKKREQAMEIYQKKLEDFNEKKEYPFTLKIAQGFAICEADSMKTVENAIHIADGRMYQHKAQLKAQTAASK
ncbi:MAG: diguanylate cyclase [Lachnospiraceae bacterium]|nr:diguanylate cyclase [Lachnospiraceae bacterium]